MYILKQLQLQLYENLHISKFHRIQVSNMA
jgi:hypothetical protein